MAFFIPARAALRPRAVLAACTLSLALGAGAQAPSVKEPVLIGVAVPTTMSFGQQNVRGIDLAVKQINAAGGVLGGRPLKTVVYDDQNKPEEGVSAVERLITRDKVVAVIGSVGTAVTAAQLTTTGRYRKVHFAHSAKSEVLRTDGHSTAFFMNTTVSMDGGKLDEYVAKELKPKRVVVYAEQSDYGEAVIASLKRNWSAPGSPAIMAVERFDKSDTDLSPVLTRIKGMNPDAVYIAPGATEMFANILKQMGQLQVPGVRIPAPGAVSSGLIKLAGKNADGLVFGDFWTADYDNAATRGFMQAFRAEYGNGVTPDKNELVAYESVWVLAQALNKAGPKARDAELAATIRNGSWNTPRGEWRFQKMGASYQAPGGFVLLTIKDGEIRPVRK